MEQVPSEIDSMNENGAQRDDYSRDYPLHLAAKKGRLKTVRNLVQSEFLGVNDLDDQNKSPLYYACLFREYSIIKLLIEIGADKTILNELKFLDNPEYREVKELLASSKITTKFFETILNGRLDRLLKEKKIFSSYVLIDKFSLIGKNLKLDWSVTDEYGKNLLFYAVEHQNSTLAQKFIDLGLDGNVFDKDGKPLLFYAIETRNLKLISLLLGNKVNLHVQNSKGANALHFLNDKLKNPEIIKFLIERGCQLDIDVVVSTVLEIPNDSLRKLLIEGNLYSEMLVEDYEKCFTRKTSIIDSAKLKNFLENHILVPQFIADILALFIQGNNIKAFEALLPMLTINSAGVIMVENRSVVIQDLLDNYCKSCDYDDPEIFKILCELDLCKKSEAQFYEYFLLCFKYDKWECAKTLRLLADSLGIGIEEMVSNFINEVKVDFENSKAGNELVQKELDAEMRSVLQRHQYVRNRALRAAFIQADELPLQLEISDNQRDLRVLQERYDNAYNVCCNLEILKDKASLGEEQNEQGFRSISDAINSNNPEAFMAHVYQDQSDRRFGPIIILPKFGDLVYAISLNPDREVGTFKLMYSDYTKEKYVANLCAIIDSILLLSDEQLASDLIKPATQGENILHIAACYSCPEVLEHLLQKLYVRFPMQKVAEMINARNNKKAQMSPLEIAILNESEEKALLLVRFGADVTCLNSTNLNMKSVPSRKKLIAFIIENKNKLKGLNQVLNANVTCGLDVGKMYDLVKHCQASPARAKEASIDQKKRNRAEFESAKFRSKVAIALSGIAVAALTAYKLFVTEKIMVSESLTIFR